MTRKSFVTSAEGYFTNGCGTVTLCGSTKFFFEYMQAQRMLTFMNWVVLSCGSYGHSYHKFAAPIDQEDYEVVKTLHFRKMAMSDAIVVVTDESNYTGSSTKAEIAFAVDYLEIPVFGYNGKGLSGAATVTKFPYFNAMHVPVSEHQLEEMLTNFKKEYGSLGF